MTVNFNNKDKIISEIGTQIFDYLTSISQDIRPDNANERPGMATLLRVINTRTHLDVPIYNPLPFAKFLAAEKTVRTECHAHKTSQDSEDIPNLKFAGCVSIYVGDEEVHASVSGLKGGAEDVTAAIILLSTALDVPIDEIISEIQEDGGALPTEIFQKDHYLYQLLEEYK